MIITNYQVQSTLRAYGEQLAQKGRLMKAISHRQATPKDQVILSTESKKKLMAEKISTEIVNQIKTGAELNTTGQQVLSRVAQEYGIPLRIEKQEGRAVVYKVPANGSSERYRSLSPEETEELDKKLLEITRSLVYNNLA